MNIQDFYNHWDKFVSQWQQGCYPGVSHLPEPWWGWHPDSREALHSVTININPAPGENSQTRSAVNKALGSNLYSDAMISGTLQAHLPKTEQWHVRERYRPAMRAMGVSDKSIGNDTSRHLSIELLPFHDDSSSKSYPKTQKKQMAQNALKFAALASGCITPHPEATLPVSLTNKVIVRAALSVVMQKVGKENIMNSQRVHVPGVENIQVETFRLVDDEVKDVIFICLSKARNHLPNKDNLKKILNSI